MTTSAVTISADHDDFATTVTDLRAAANRFRERRARICREVDALLDGGWRGPAADSFAESWEDWSRAAQRVLDGLLEMGALLDAVHGDLTDRDEQVELRLHTIAGRVGDRLG